MISTQLPDAPMEPVPKPGGAEQGCWCPGDPPHGRDFSSPWSHLAHSLSGDPGAGLEHPLRLGASSAARCGGRTSSERQLPLQPPASHLLLSSVALLPGSWETCCRRCSTWHFSLQSANSIYFSHGRQGYEFDKGLSSTRCPAASQLSGAQAGNPATWFKTCGNCSFPAFRRLWSSPWGVCIGPTQLSLSCVLPVYLFSPDSVPALLVPKILWRCREINTGPGDSGTPQEGSRQSQRVGAKSSLNSCLEKPVCE